MPSIRLPDARLSKAQNATKLSPQKTVNPSKTKSRKAQRRDQRFRAPRQQATHHHHTSSSSSTTKKQTNRMADPVTSLDTILHTGKHQIPANKHGAAAACHSKQRQKASKFTEVHEYLMVQADECIGRGAEFVLPQLKGLGKKMCMELGMWISIHGWGAVGRDPKAEARAQEMMRTQREYFTWEWEGED